MANEYSLIIGTSLDTKGAEQALDNFIRKTSNTKILNFSDGSKQLKTLTTYANDAGTTFKRLTTQIQKADGSWELIGNKITQINTKFNEFNAATVETSKNIHKIIKDNGDLVTTITSINEKGESITTTITESNNGLGRLTKTTEVYNNTLQKQISIHTDSIDNQVKEIEKLEKLNQYKQQLTTTTKEEVQTVEREGESYKAVVKTIQEQISANETLTTTITTYKNQLGETVVETEKVNQAGEHVAQTTKTVTKELDKASAGNKKFSNSAKQAAQETKTLGQSLSDAFSRLSKYYLASLPIQAFRNSISEAVTTVKEFDSALIEFRKVSDLAGESLTNYVAKLAEMGEVTGSTMQAMVEASTEFRKSGFSDEDSAKLASIAEKYRNIADEEISAGESASFIIAQMKAFNIEADQAEHIIDSVNEVANNFSVSSADLATNLGNMSAIMAINNVSMEEQIGMLTGVTEITRNASSASRGLVMISSRLTQVLDSTSSTGKKLTAIYNNLGIALKDENGQLRSHYDILGDLAVKWNTLSENEQKYIALTSAGARQQQNFVALMENWNQVASATTTAYESMGSAQRENEKVMDSVAKKVEILRSEFQQIVIGDGGLQEFAKGLLDVGVEALKLVDSLGGLPSILITLTTLIVSLNALNIYKNITNVINAVKDIPMILTRATLSWNAYKAGVMSANAAMEASMPIIGAIGAAIGIIISAIVAHNKKLEEQKEKIRENIQAFSNEYKSLDDISKKLQDENISREELNQIIDSNLDEYEAERLKLLNINDAREKTIDLIKAEKEARAQELVDTGLSEYEESLDKIKNGYKEVYEFINDLPENNAKITQAYLKSGLAYTKSAKEQKDALVEFKNQILELRTATEEAGQKGSYEWHQYNNALKDTEGLMVSVNEQFSEDNKVVTSFDSALNTLGKHYSETTSSIEDGAKRSYIAEEERRKGLEKLKNETKETSQSLADLKKQYNITDDAIYDYIDAHQDEVITIEEATQALIDEAMAQEDVVVSADKLAETYKDVHGETKNLISNISKLSSALKEQSENGSIAVETQLDLIESGYGAALMYDKETGACKLDEKAVVELTQAKLEMQIANLNIERSKVVDQLIREANQAVTTAGAFLELAKAKNIANQASLENSIGRGYSASYSGYGNNGGYLSDDIKESRELLNSYNKEIEALEKELKSVKTNGAGAFNTLSSGAKKSAGATKSATDAQKDLNKELEDTLDKYKKVISWISTQYDKEIDSIKDAKDEAIEAEEAKIKAKEKEKDAALDYIQQKINALEKEKKALKAQKEVLDDRKEALKDEEDAIVDGIEKRIKALEKERDAIIKPVEDKIKALEKERDAIVDSTENKIKALEKERDAIIDATQAEIDSINELKEARQNYWDEQIDALKKANQELKDNLELQEKLDALEKAKNTKVKIYKEGQGFVYDVDQTEVDKAQKALDEYLSQKAYEDELARLENLKDAEIQSYNDRLKELNDYKDKTKKSYDEQLDNLKEYKDNVKDNYDKQLDDLKNYKDNVKENYSEQIEALKEYKETVQEEYAEKIKILEDDIDALEAHMDVLDEHKEKLEEHKDEVEAAYEAEIELLNEHKDNLEAAYDAEIEIYEDYKQAFEDMVNAYEEEQNRLLAEQLTGISFENNNWMTRLDNLANFVNEYNRLQAQLDTGTTDATNTASMSSGGGGGGTSTGGSGTTTTTKTVTNQDTPNNQYSPTQNSKSTLSNSTGKTGYVPTSVTDALGTNSSGTIKSHASGVNSIREDEIAIVGENPNKEIVLGSKINNGKLMSLEKGAGVVNADSSKTLAGMLNQVGQFGSSGFGSGNGTLNNNINNDSLVVNGVTIEGSQIKDPETFVNGLLNLKAEALQRAYRHR